MGKMAKPACLQLKPNIWTQRSMSRQRNVNSPNIKSPSHRSRSCSSLHDSWLMTVPWHRDTWVRTLLACFMFSPRVRARCKCERALLLHLKCFAFPFPGPPSKNVPMILMVRLRVSARARAAPGVWMRAIVHSHVGAVETHTHCLRLGGDNNTQYNKILRYFFHLYCLLSITQRPQLPCS